MKKLVVPALLVAGLSASLLVGATSVSWAQETKPSCAQAISAFLDARTAFEKLPEKIDNPALVKLAEAAEKATKTRDERQAALTTAKANAVNGSTGLTDGDLNQAKIEQLRKDFPEGNPSRPIAQEQIRLIQAVLAAQADLNSAQSALDAATKARKDAPARIDNPALTKGPEFDALVKTQNAADKACEGQPGDPGPVNPTPTTTPAPTTTPQPAPVANNTNTDSGFEQVGSVPVGGAETGGGPA